MKRYKAADGAEVVEYLDGKAASKDFMWVEHPTLGLIQVTRRRLTELPPPLPPEPSEPGFYLGFVPRCDPFIVERQADGWLNVSARTFAKSWEELHDDWPGIELIRLVPDPLAEAPELPWEYVDDDGDRVVIDRDGSDVFVNVRNQSGSDRVTVHVKANEMGLALIKAAAS